MSDFGPRHIAGKPPLLARGLSRCRPRGRAVRASGRSNRGAPRVDRRGAKCAVRFGRGDVALDVKGVVDALPPPRRLMRILGPIVPRSPARAKSIVGKAVAGRVNFHCYLIDTCPNQLRSYPMSRDDVRPKLLPGSLRNQLKSKGRSRRQEMNRLGQASVKRSGMRNDPLPALHLVHMPTDDLACRRARCANSTPLISMKWRVRSARLDSACPY
jgi:hypothetical protein